MGNLCGTPASRSPANQQNSQNTISKGENVQLPATGVPEEFNKPPAKAVRSPTDCIKDVLESADIELRESSARKFADSYDTGKLIGHGAFAKVSLCTNRKTGVAFAVKIVPKNNTEPEKQRDGIVREIAIMKTLKGHENVVDLIEFFEDEQAYMLVMELCTGGELFDQIISKGHFSEKDAADKMRSLLHFIAFAHSRNVIHRDLKPENILLTDNTPSASIKIIDFGTSDFCLSGQRLSQKFGTPYYVAPEVLRKNYDKSSDIWSAGVILYILLCGYPPFGGKTDAKILQRVQAGVYSFEGREWEVVTEAAKDMITMMLVMDIPERASAKDLLRHRWFQVAPTAPAAALGAHMVKRLRAFAAMGKMKRLALVVLARTLTDKDVKRLRELFSAMDTNNDGRIDSLDLHNALEKVGAAIQITEMRDLFHASDVDGSGQIDYEQFIASMLDSNRVARRKEAVRTSFDQLDMNGDGYITAEDIVRVMPRGSSIEAATLMVREVDTDGDGRVDYAEFHHMMQQA